MALQANITNLQDSVFFNLEYYNYEKEGDTLCEVCAKYDKVAKSADSVFGSDINDMDLCTDCFQEIWE